MTFVNTEKLLKLISDVFSGLIRACRRHLKKRRYELLLLPFNNLLVLTCLSIYEACARTLPHHPPFAPQLHLWSQSNVCIDKLLKCMCEKDTCHVWYVVVDHFYVCACMCTYLHVYVPACVCVCVCVCVVKMMCRNRTALYNIVLH